MKKFITRGIVGLLATATVFMALFMVTRGMDPYAAELAFVEVSASGIGSVIPASCESGFEHFPGACWGVGPAAEDVNVSISPNPVTADGVTQHTITANVFYADGVHHVTETYVIINLEGVNAGQHRGYLGWSFRNFDGWFGAYKNPPIACAGGGFGAIYGGSHGPEYINLVSCNTSWSGQNAVIRYVVTFNTNFTAPVNTNTFSGDVMGTSYVGTGPSWKPSGTFNLVSANQPPVVDAGPDIQVERTVGIVTISGASAIDPENLPMTYNWTNIVSPGSAPTISGGTSLTPTFSNVPTVGTYVFQLAVTDSVGNITTDQMNVNVIDVSPTLDRADATNCVITAGQSTCGSQVSWLIGNPVTPIVTATPNAQPTTQISTSASGALTHQIPRGTTVFDFRDRGTSIDTRTVTASCAPGTIWNELNACIVLQGTINANPNLVPYNGLTTLTWNVPNSGNLSCYALSTNSTWRQDTPTGSSQDPNPITAQRTYALRCVVGGSVVNLAQTVVNLAQPSLTATPRIVQQGSTSNLNYNTQGQNCTLLGNAVFGSGTVQTPPINAQTTYTLICPLGNVSATVEILPIGFET